MSDRHANLESWLGPPTPCERMLVYDRYGTCLGRVKEVGCEEVTVVANTPGLFAEHHVTRRIDMAHCRVHAGAVHTSYASEQLDAVAT